jgi:hypothetical protein
MTFVTREELSLFLALLEILLVIFEMIREPDTNLT